ncbi:fasciclin domain-containing protein [uncultured Polaribacter sp.]|uniref:fasciclin domain-containing protein n=1 Tax=uncultured Polaribacter sp. TaxID=174711 RepID=UPI00261DB6BA|nr:fasciclin domain-containing protein [uncultured Polaribacter sp.]
MKELLMKNKNKYIYNLSFFVAVLTILVTIIGCKDDAWENHYKELDSSLENNLLSVLSEGAEYTVFVDLLEQTGYDALLETPQAYTVWAPNNTALAQVSTDILNAPDLLSEFIGNHISRFSYNTSFAENSVLVKMLNNKSIQFSNSSGSVTFGDVNVVEKDILTANGILHKIDDVLTVRPNVFDYLNDNALRFPILLDFLTQFNETVFDEVNSVKIGTNTLGQPVYDSIFNSSNSYFNIIGNLSSEEERYTFIGLTDAVYENIFDDLYDYYQHPVADSTKYYTDSAIFSNLNFPIVNLEDLDGSAITTTTGNNVIINSGNVIENYALSNGNLFVVDQLDYDPKNIIYKKIRYEVENSSRREIGSLSDFTIQKKYDINASGDFTNTVSLTKNPNANNSNNYFEIAFSNVLSANYNIDLKFSPIGAAKQTKLKFEFSYVDENENIIVNEIPAIIISNQEDGVVRIGGTYAIPVYINSNKTNNFFVKLKVIIDVSEPELLLYDRSFGIDYAELVPID